MFFKRISLLILAFVCTSNATVYFPKGITANHVRQTQKKDLQIAWDIHNVLAKKDTGAKVSAIFGNLFNLAWTKMAGNDAWDEIDQLSSNKKNEDISGEAHFHIFLKHGQIQLAQMTEEAANAYKPRKGIELIVQEIDRAGIMQRLASNIGPRFLSNMNAKFQKKFQCRIFMIIKQGKIVDYSKYGKNVRTTLSIELSPVAKPHPQFFIDFNTTYRGKKSYIIFIDDKLENVLAAVRAGWIGIHFDATKKDKKALALLRADLIQLGIL